MGNRGRSKKYNLTKAPCAQGAPLNRYFLRTLHLESYYFLRVPPTSNAHQFQGTHSNSHAFHAFPSIFTKKKHCIKPNEHLSAHGRLDAFGIHLVTHPENHKNTECSRYWQPHLLNLNGNFRLMQAFLLIQEYHSRLKCCTPLCLCVGTWTCLCTLCHFTTP